MRNHLSRATLLAGLLILAGLFQVSGCASPAYYSQAISGHLSLMRKRQDIDVALASGQLGAEQSARLRQAAGMLRFASEKLGLPNDGSYQTFVQTGSEATTWNVVAAQEFSVEPETWCFPVAGCVPYRGYFDREKARKFESSLARKGLDTDISPAIAYSTLGWFDDPLLDTMLRYSDEQLAGILFHELAHQQLYLKGDTAFNEAYASFVEQAGVQQWLRSPDQAQRDQAQRDQAQPDQARREQAWRDSQQAASDFNRLLQDARSDLRALYASELPVETLRDNKARRFGQLESDYRRLVNQEWQGKDYFSNWFSRDLNNARLALMNSYEGGRCAFEALFEKAGYDFVRFHQMAKQKSLLDDQARTEWLDQPCDEATGGIAPGDNL